MALSVTALSITIYDEILAGERTVSRRLDLLSSYWGDYMFGELSETAKTRAEVPARLLPHLKIVSRCEMNGAERPVFVHRAGPERRDRRFVSAV